MSGVLFVHDESALKKILQDVDSIAVAGEAQRWRAFWTEQGLDLMNVGAPEELSPAEVPHPDSREWKRTLRAVARRAALKKFRLREKAWHVHYPDLSDDQVGFPLSTSEEYEEIGRHVFTTGAMPSGLEVLDEQPDVTTNWMSSLTVSRLWALEQTEGMLSVVGQALAAERLPFGHDLLDVRAAIEYAAAGGHALYLWDPGS